MVSTLLQLDTTQRLVGSLQRLSLGELPVKDLSSRINWLGTPKAGNAPQVIARTTVIESPAIATRVEVPTNTTPIAPIPELQPAATLEPPPVVAAPADSIIAASTVEETKVAEQVVSAPASIVADSPREIVDKPTESAAERAPEQIAVTDKVSVTATVTQPVVEAPQVAEPTAEPVKAVVQAQASSPIEVAKAELPAEQIAAAIPETRAAPLRAPQAAPQATPKEPAKRVTQVTTVEPATPQPRVRPDPKKQSALKPVTPAATIPDENYTQRLERLVIALSMDLGAMDDSADAFNSTTEAELALLRRRLITLSLENLQLREQLSETMPA